MEITIRKATEEDFLTVLNLEHELATFEKKPEKVKNTIKQMMQEKNHFECFIAECDTQIIGMVICFFSYYISCGKSLFVNALYVKEAYRGQKIGKKLLDTVVDFAKKEDCKKISWQVEKWNTSAIKFYKQYGASIDDGYLDCDINLINQ